MATMRPRRIATAAALALAVTPVTAAFAGTGPYQTQTVTDAVTKSGAMGSVLLRWNPCVTLHWAVNTAGAPKNFVAEAKRAVADMAHATGEKWAYAGTTSVRPQLDGSGSLVGGPLAAKDYQLVIAWDTRSSSHSVLKLQSGEAGETVYLLGGSMSSSGNQSTVTPTQLTQAAIVLDRTQEKSLVANDKKGNGLYRLLLHELGHAAGLAHVYDGKQIMNPTGTPKSPTTYQSGDKAGLHKVGIAAGCLNTTTT